MNLTAGVAHPQRFGMNGRGAAGLTLAAAAILGVACGPGDAPAGREPGTAISFVERKSLELEDGAAPVLGRPDLAVILRGGPIAISDASDRNIKLYDGLGKRQRAIGRAGNGPGEFTTLSGIGLIRDTLVAYDFPSGRLSRFGALGELHRSNSLVDEGTVGPWSARVADDSLVLLISLPMAAPRRALLQLHDERNGRSRSFFNRQSYFGDDSRLLQLTGIVADAHAGVVFVAIEDSLFAFSYTGARLAAGLIDPDHPIEPIKRLLESEPLPTAGLGDLSFLDGHRRVVQIVALDRATALVQIAPYDIRVGIDRLDGGELLAVAVGNDGQFQLLGRRSISAGLVGRADGSTGLLLGYAMESSDRYRLTWLELVDQTGTSR